jgi:hypothetical protein
MLVQCNKGITNVSPWSRALLRNQLISCLFWKTTFRTRSPLVHTPSNMNPQYSHIIFFCYELECYPTIHISASQVVFHSYGFRVKSRWKKTENPNLNKFRNSENCRPYFVQRIVIYKLYFKTPSIKTKIFFYQY